MWPGTSGSFGFGSSPSTMWRSVRQTAQVDTRSRTWPGPGSGTGSSSSRSGSPAAWSTIARTTDIVPCGHGRNQVPDVSRGDDAPHPRRRLARPNAAGDRSSHADMAGTRFRTCLEWTVRSRVGDRFRTYLEWTVRSRDGDDPAVQLVHRSRDPAAGAGADLPAGMAVRRPHRAARATRLLHR